MRTPTRRLTAIGAAVGLVFAASAITPAVAAPVTTAVSSATCSTLDNRTTTGSAAEFALTLRGGDKVVTSVSPAKTGDKIFLSGAMGLNLIFADGPTTGMVFIAPVDGTYNLKWSLQTTSTPTSALTWSFDTTCSSGTVTSPSPSPSPTAPTKPGKGKGKG
jgi:hypothetical protein